MNRDFLLFIIGLAIILSAAYAYAENNGPQYSAPCGSYGDCGIITKSTSGGSGGCGGCGNSVSAGGAGTDPLASVKEIASDYYRDIYGNEDFQVQVTDYGCHFQADIIKDGKIVKSLSIYGTKIYELG